MCNATKALAALLEDADYATRHVKPEFKSYYMSNHLISENVVIQAHARWMARVSEGEGLPRYQCSHCGDYVKAGDDRNFCPTCGAKMDA